MAPGSAGRFLASIHRFPESLVCLGWVADGDGYVGWGWLWQVLSGVGGRCCRAWECCGVAVSRHVGFDTSRAGVWSGWLVSAGLSDDDAS